jgi:hypothetical protein
MVSVLLVYERTGVLSVERSERRSAMGAIFTDAG